MIEVVEIVFGGALALGSYHSDETKPDSEDLEVFVSFSDEEPAISGGRWASA
jgi:predicted nucleotidyltransferase